MANVVVNSRFQVRLRWRDLDNQGHVYHATYFTLLDEARTEFLRSLRIESPSAYVLVRIEMDYVRELTLEDPVVSVEFTVLKVGKSSLHLVEELSSAGSVRSRSRSVIVLWDKVARGTRELLPHEREALQDARTESGEAA